MKEEKKYERIERYLSGELSPSERQAFEAAMAEDPKLQAEVKLQREIAEAIGENDVAEFEATLDIVMRNGRATPARRRWPGLLIVAVLLLFLLWLGSRWLQNRDQTASPEQIYASYLDLPEELPGSVRLRSAGDIPPTPDSSQVSRLRENWIALNQAYRTDQYEEALALLEKLPSLDPDFSQENPGAYHYYRGLIQLQMDRPAEAAEAFAEVDSGNYLEDASWKRALALLMIEDRRHDALEILRQISNRSHPRQEAAREILGKLEKW